MREPQDIPGEFEGKAQTNMQPERKGTFVKAHMNSWLTHGINSPKQRGPTSNYHGAHTLGFVRRMVKRIGG